MPFCERKCDYCDFYSVPGAADSLVSEVLSETAKELVFFLERMPNARIETVFIGGGTPSSISRRALDGFIRTIRKALRMRIVEWTIEANPQSIDQDFLDICATNGIDRISIGIQSLDRRSLAAVGRNANATDNERAIRLIAGHWKGDVSIDLLSGLPMQDVSSLLDGIKSCITGLAPEHVSLYSLTVEEGTELSRRVAACECQIPEIAEQDELWLCGCRLLEELGYEQYEISNFAKPGKQCIHNLKYWRMEPYLGIGPAAVSTLPEEGCRVVRIENPKDLSEFLGGIDTGWNSKYERISPGDFAFENFMMGLRLKEGIAKKTFLSRFSVSMEETLDGLLDAWRERNLARTSPKSVFLTFDGRLLLNALLRELSAHLDSVRLFDSLEGVAWP